ncbi:MAG: hypothetical protein H3C27_12860 [Opitutaceae bacterium]|nr:hypothetical protein [Opitutaceae bacterium]
MKATGHSPATAPLWPILALLAAALWLWISWCRMPASSWNDLRLAPVFMAAAGEPVYTLPGAGVLTTWMYGPVPLWLWSPALLAQDAVSAVLVAGATNLLWTVGALLTVCLLWPCPDANRADRLLAAALCVAVWPEPAFRFLQADNLVVAGGLVANLLLVRAGGRPLLLWGAAIATVVALGSKQTAVGLLLAQLVWLARTQGLAAMRSHIGRIIAAGVPVVGVALIQFGPRELWFGIVTVPAALPWVEDPLARLTALAPILAGQWLIPVLIVIALGRRLLATNPVLTLGFATFACTLPFDTAGLLSTGGSTNNLHGFQLLTPPLLLALLGLARRRGAAAPALIAAAVVVTGGARIWEADHVPLAPATERMLAADALIRAAPGELWLPWSPLVTWFAEGRFDHAEDGIYVRFITGHPVALTHARAHLPPRFGAMALPAGADWGVAEKLAGHPSTESKTGGWRVVRWATPEPGR